MVSRYQVPRAPGILWYPCGCPATLQQLAAILPPRRCALSATASLDDPVIAQFIHGWGVPSLTTMEKVCSIMSAFGLNLTSSSDLGLKYGIVARKYKHRARWAREDGFDGVPQAALGSAARQFLTVHRKLRYMLLAFQYTDDTYARLRMA